MTADNAYAVPRGNGICSNGHNRSPSLSSMDAIIGVASAGFRLSLLLNAVGTGMTNPDCDIHNIAKHISLFSLMLKQTGAAMKSEGSTTSQAAVDVATEISHQGQLVFEEIRNMTDLSQGRDEKGILRSVTMAEANKWAFKKYKVQYLLGQLESLKLSLAVMLQVLQMGQSVASARHDPSTKPLAGNITMQERAEVQNMIVVQHWSLVELRRLYDLAENEAKDDAMAPHPDTPPPSYDSHRAIEPSYYAQKATEGDLHLAIVTPPVSAEDTSRAMVRYQERPVQQLDAAFTRALVKENRALGANVNNIVDHLLQEWTQISELDSTPISRERRPSLSTYYESDEEDTTESEYEASHVKGRYIEAPRRKVKKDVRFQPRVESDSEEESEQKQRHRAPRRHILHSETDTSSSDSDLSPGLPRSRQPGSRRSSETGANRYVPNPQDFHDRNPRPYASTGRSYRHENVASNPTPRPTSFRGIPPPPMGPVPSRSVPNVNQWQGTPPIPQPGLRPPSYHGTSSGPSHPPSANYAPPGYMSHSPQIPSGNYFPQQQQRPSGPPMPQAQPHQRPHRHRKHRSEMQKAEEDKHAATKNMKRGLFGGAALAGMLDLLQGLDGI